ncbi:hypothetical protein ACH5RR_024358 [Cinchona calisaya]|uniref:Nuclear transcription factor Y subunit n=1 Tax=Cinchona calisaya TaxID=153742 RepID=A0ABD2YWF2_9GENT
MPNSIPTTSSIFTNSRSAHSVAPCIDHSHPWWASTDSQGQQSSLSRNLSFNMVSPMDCFPGTKQLGFNIQDQESSSTQSTGQSCREEASVENENYGKNVMSIQPGCCGVHVKPEEDQSKSTISFQDCVLPCSSIDCRQYASYPFTYPDTYNHGLLSAYGTYPVVHSQMMGMTPFRVPLPLDASQDEPVFVNAKQFKAIMRRRESRAKLEAQNKLSKIRKPYLHESRHRHALKRERGSGGRFLNTKKLQESKAIVKTNSHGHSGSTQHQLNMETMESEVHKTESQKEGISLSCSDVTSVPTVDNVVCHQQFRFSGYQSHIGGSLLSGGGGRTDGVKQFLSILR